MTRIVVALAGVLLLMTLLASSLVTAQSSDPAAVLSAYEMARNRRDVDAALAYFADDAQVTQRSTTFSGKDEIRRYLEASTNRGRFNTVSERRVEGERLSWTERSGSQGGNQAFTGFQLSVEAVVRDGKIRSISYNGSLTPNRGDPANDGRAQLPAMLGLGSVVLLLAGIVLVISTAGRRRPALASTLQGRLLEDLQGWTAARGFNG